jgi:hypothetical protein
VRKSCIVATEPVTTALPQLTVDDLVAYVEFCQRQLLTPGAEDVFNAALATRALKSKADRVRGMSQEQTGDSDAFECLLAMHENFRPETQYEVPQTSAIFEPLFSEIRETAERCGIRPLRDVRIATSTEMSATPYARPSPNGEHLLFIGLGTSTFCNYWAKAYTALLHVLANSNPGGRCTGRKTLEDAFRKDPRPLSLMQKLAFYYAAHGSLIGFGEVRQPADHLGYRLQLLQAMELFVVAHEFSHFVVEERLPAWRGSLEAQEIHASELFCDELGFTLSRQARSASESFDAFTATGALVFLRAMELCLAVREFVTGRVGESGAHPDICTRVELLRHLVRTRTAPDQIDIAVAFFDEYDLIATSLRDLLLALMSGTQDFSSDGRS